jgi:hypothetical protein
MFPVAAAVALAVTFSWDPMDAEHARLLDLELARFPSAQVTQASFDLNDKHLDWLNLQLEYSPTSQIIEWNNESSWYRRCWGNLKLAQYQNHNLGMRLDALQSLRTELGEVPFALGRMPPPVPIWRFKEGAPPLGTLPVPRRGKQTGVVNNPPPQ